MTDHRLGQTKDGTPLLLLGVTREEFETMSRGGRREYDLTKSGVPIRIMLWCAETEEGMQAMLDAGAAKMRENGT